MTRSSRGGGVGGCGDARAPSRALSPTASERREGEKMTETLKLRACELTMTPPLSICANPCLTFVVPILAASPLPLPLLPLPSFPPAMLLLLRALFGCFRMRVCSFEWWWGGDSDKKNVTPDVMASTLEWVGGWRRLMISMIRRR